MRSLSVRGWCAVSCLPLLVACGGENDSNDTKQPAEQALPVGCSHTQFDGDSNCIAAPDPSKGMQLHVGPKNYDDQAELAAFLLGPDEENVSCFTLQAPNTETVYYFEQQNRMRPNSHHMIIRIVPEDTPVGWGHCENAGSIGGIPGSQTPVRDIPGQQLAPENEGFGRTLPANAKVQFELHYVNRFREVKEPVLREAWVNLLYKDQALITDRIRGVSLIGGLGMEIDPHTQESLNQSCKIVGDARIVNLFGHFHAHTERFTAWRKRDGQRELIYQSFNWAEPVDLSYDTVNKNPAPNEAAGTDGGWNGTLEVQTNDEIEWQCDVNNTLETPLKFANEAYTAEMCILFGGFVSQNTSLRMTCYR